MEKRLTAAEIARQIEEGNQMVKGRFNYKENPGGIMKIANKQGKGTKLFRQPLKDGNEYTIPLFVADYINNHCRYPKLTAAVDEKGREIPNTSVEIQVQRAEFSIYEFIKADKPADFIKVTKMTPVTPMPAN